MDALAAAAAAAVVEVVGASVVVLLLLVVVSRGMVANVEAVVADADWDLAESPPSADEHATMLSATAIPTATRPLGRLSILITAFDSAKSDIVPHFFPRGRQILKFRRRWVDTSSALGGSFQRGFVMTCPTCRSTTLVEIGLHVHDQLVTMHSCSTCENRWWDRGGERVSLPSVLELVASK
jgi:hypothetical protein